MPHPCPIGRYPPGAYDERVGVKIAVIGGGSTYTPELVEGLATHAERLPVDELVLHDIDAERLRIVGGLGRRILDRLGWSGTFTLTGDRTCAIDAASFVVVQLRVGGQAARLVDETLPLRFGCIGQETTGPGGFAKALRTVPVVLEIAEETTRRGAAGAWMVDFTNPVGIVTQALLDKGYPAIGLCNVAIGFQRRFAEMFAVDPARVRLDHVGLNHLSWVRAVLVDGVDRLPQLLGEYLDEVADETTIPAGLVQAMGASPSYYLRYYYCTDTVLEEQRTRPSRAEEVMAIERELLRMYADPNLAAKPKLLAERGGAYYSVAAAELMASLHAGTGDVQVVDVRGGGTMPGLPDDAVVEVPARIDRDGAHPLPAAPLPPEMLGLVQQVKAYERLTVAASTSGDRTVALKALLAHPLVRQYRIAAPLLEAMLAANREHLPLFFPHVP